MFRQRVATDADYIMEQLDRKAINYCYSELADLFWFDSYDDYMRGEQIICDIVGYNYQTDRNNLEIKLV